MINILKRKLNKVLLLMVIFILSLSNFAFAEDEIKVDYDIYNSFEGWYKNWIMELGGVRITLRDTEGEILTDLNVLPKQWENKDNLQRKLNTEGNDSKKDKNGNEIFFMQKAEGKVNFKEFMPDLEIKYSDNIPQLAKRTGSDGNTLPYVYFKDFSEYETVDTWEAYNNGENVNKLVDDLGLTSFSEGKVFYEWLKTANGEGLSPSLELQPLCLYPETTEQIYCNKLDVAKEFILQWNSDYGAFEEAFGELSTATGIWKLIDQAATFIKLKLGLGMVAFYDIGIMHYEGIEGETIHEGYSGNSEVSYAKVINAQDPKYINLTYTQTTIYQHPWETDGFWKNFQKFDGPMAIGYYDFSTSIEVSGGKIYDLSDPNKEYKTIKAIINGSTYTVERAMVLKNEYEARYEIWQEQTFGIGEGTTIKTDHNKFTTIINGTGKLIEKLLTIPDFDTSTLPKYGAGLIPMTNIATASNADDISIKFHANLEHCGSGGTTPEPAPDPQYTHWINCTHIEESNTPKDDGTYWYTETYTVMGQTFTYTFKKEHEGGDRLHKKGEEFTIPKTYPDSIGAELKKEDVKDAEGNIITTFEAPTYSKYNTKPDGSGTTYPIGSKIVVNEPTILYCIWEDGDGDNLSGAEGTGRTLTLFEDELSYVYESTRKLMFMERG